MHGPNPTRSDTRLEATLRTREPGGSEISLIDLVLFACDLSEDPGDVSDLVAGAIETGAARILPGSCDPMMDHQRESAPFAERAA